MITLTGITGRPTIAILRGEIDIHVYEVVGQMLGQGILGLLLIPTLLAQSFEILNERIMSGVLGEWDDDIPCMVRCVQLRNRRCQK